MLQQPCLLLMVLGAAPVFLMSNATAWPPLDGGLLFAYFRQIYGERVEITPEGTRLVQLDDYREKYTAELLHYALSDDGLHWRALNQNKPVWERAVVGDIVLRDPFLNRAPDGSFHLIGTSRHHMGQPCAIHWQTRDLTDWGTPSYLPLIDGHPELHNIWAPEWVWDEENGEFFVFWSSSRGQTGWDQSSIWAARTRDWVTFTPAKMLLDPGYTIIDATLLQHDGYWWMAFKDERFGFQHGEHRFIKMACSSQLDGPYEVLTEAVTPQLTEGPDLFPNPGGEGWFLSYDFCMANGYGVSHSTNLLDWVSVSATDFPSDARHGCVVPISAQEKQRLIERYGS